ncbi:hypothetical protein FLAG1_09748 [Fusarium langsethiae]|uniref:Knr4/Smi1-like domain-containing protein n=1 Tax=Fusarium langsethiae TaxID=179993 RepID=A0A0M9EQG9_FUSLA|nr:hypothetical protein FLAG1_09748 [Fusarium langsethiae]GKU06832.1 unnamed protein product [Fusarium langsethiae]GKU20081.1 unnamed protein product [Fusarium langsethiae]
MYQPRKFDRDSLLTNPSLSEVYNKLVNVASEFAVLGEIETTKTLVSLLLRETTSDWQRKQLRNFEPFFAAADLWPDEISDQDKTKKSASNTATKHSLDDEANEEGRNDEKKLQEQMKQARDESSSVAVDALCTAIRLASKQTEDLQDIKSDSRVQQTLELIAENLHRSRVIPSLVAHHELCEILSTGELARKVPIDKEKLEATGKEVVATFTDRFTQGRKKHAIESKPLKEVLLELERHTKANGTSSWDEMDEPVPETLFVLPPATDEQISSLEKKLDIILPDDYKNFLKISNGFGGTWNGYHLDNSLYGVDAVHWADERLDVPFVEFHDSTSGVLELRVNDMSGPEWPSSGRTVEIGSWDVLSTLLIPPKNTRMILDAYQEALDDSKIPDDAKKQTMKSIKARYGSLEEMQKLEWAAIERHDSETLPSGTFRQCLEERLRRAKRGPYLYGTDKELGGIAYSCKADDS